MKSSTQLVRRRLAVAALLLAMALRCVSAADDLVPKPDDPFFSKFEPKRAPASDGLLLRPDDRLAIIGDSITEQRMYSRIIETYLTACVPELKVTTRQFGWSGETAEGFLHRMTNDCLRFKPTVATLCYGMNDHRYRAYDDANAEWYRQNYSAVARSLKAAGARVVLGSPGSVGKVPRWAPDTNAPVEDLNLNLCRLRNIDIDIAAQEQIRFADVFWPMFVSGHAAAQRFGPDYAVSGKDGVHPAWAGHVVMAYAFLKAMGCDGNIGTLTLDLAGNKATATTGHTIDSFDGKTVAVTSRRYPFCATGASDSDNSIRSGMTLVPFNEELNRFLLVVKGGTAANYSVTWGDETRGYTAAQLAAGVNLAADFAINPFSEAFSRVDNAVAAKQAYETRKIKELFHGPEGKTDADATAALTEEVRRPLADRIGSAFVPVKYTIRIEPK